MAYEPQFTLGWNLPSGLLQMICRYEEWLLFSDITIRDEYGRAIDYVTQTAKKEITFLDLGANVGFASWSIADKLMRSGKAFKGLLVEANPETFQELRRRVKSQEKNLKGNILVPINGLVGKLSGTTLLRIDGCHTISRAYETAAPDGGVYIEEVPYINIEDYLDDEPIDLIKCDIETSEWDFVENYQALLARTGCVVMEIHNVYKPVQLIYDIMKKAGLSRHEILKVNGDVSTEMFTRPPLPTYSGTGSNPIRPVQNRKRLRP